MQLYQHKSKSLLLGYIFYFIILLPPIAAWGNICDPGYITGNTGSSGPSQYVGAMVKIGGGYYQLDSYFGIFRGWCFKDPAASAPGFNYTNAPAYIWLIVIGNATAPEWHSYYGCYFADAYEFTYHELWPRPCFLKICDFSSSSPAIRPSTGETMNFSWSISEQTATTEIRIAGMVLTGNSWDGKDGSGKFVPPGSYTATLTATNADGCSDSKSLTITILPAPANICPANVNTN